MTTFRDAIAEAANLLAEEGIDAPRREAKLIMELATGYDASKLLIHLDETASGDALGSFSGFVDRRCNGEPFAYISGEREFWSLPIMVSPATLIPRPDTETVIELALLVCRERAPKRILDLGTGSGCILAALLSEWPEALGVGIDDSASALGIAAANMNELGLNDRSTLIAGSWMSGVFGTFDLIVSNPPYIRSEDILALDSTVREFEPVGALDGGSDGLSAYRCLIPEVSSVLTENGAVILEVGQGQGPDVEAIAAESGLAMRASRADLSGIMRAISFDKKSVGNTGGSR